FNASNPIVINGIKITIKIIFEITEDNVACASSVSPLFGKTLFTHLSIFNVVKNCSNSCFTNFATNTPIKIMTAAAIIFGIKYKNLSIIFEIGAATSVIFNTPNSVGKNRINTKKYTSFPIFSSNSFPLLSSSTNGVLLNALPNPTITNNLLNTFRAIIAITHASNNNKIALMTLGNSMTILLIMLSHVYFNSSTILYILSFFSFPSTYFKCQLEDI